MALFPLGLLTLTGNARRFETKRWNSDDTPEPIKKIAQIMIQQLNKRFKLEGIPDANTLLAMKLNPTVNKVRDSFVTMLVVFLTRLVGIVQEAAFSSSQRDAMNEAYDLLFNKTASFYFAPSARLKLRLRPRSPVRPGPRRLLVLLVTAPQPLPLVLSARAPIAPPGTSSPTPTPHSPSTSTTPPTPTPTTLPPPT